MGIKEKYINPDESILWEGKPFFGVLVFPIFLFIVLLFAGLAGITYIPKSAPLWTGILSGIPAFVALIYTLFKYLKWHSYSLTITTKRIIESYGILSRNTRDIPLRKIQSISVRQKIHERLLMAGTLVIESAGGGPDGKEEFPAISRVNSVFHLLSSELNQD